MESQIKACRDEIAKLKDDIANARGEEEELLSQVAEDSSQAAGEMGHVKARKLLKGHFGKIYALDWANDSEHIVSASQDGKLVVWHAMSTNKVEAIPLRSSWVMSVCYSPSQNFVASGGLDNLCSLFKLPYDDPNQTKVYAELNAHEGYLSCASFLSDEEIITSSGDSNCILWDIETKSAKRTFDDHQSDVMSLAVHANSNLFVSGSCDATAKLWDFRDEKAPVKTFGGHESDINAIAWCGEGGFAFGTGSDDSSLRLHDIRAYRQVNKYCDSKIVCGITSMGFSKTGKYLFGGYDDYNVYVWDTATGKTIHTLSGHENRVTCLGVPKTGQCLCTASWDLMVKIWA
jgi:guanine nucleotide-binding protein G(I)/G(S)/G(T) subunit beta-1